MVDLLYVVLTIVFLAVTWGFIIACDRLMKKKEK